MQAVRKSESSSQVPEGASAWHLKLFSKSVLKQRKLKEITALLGELEGKRCLDLGSDNGVISYYLRARGGDWTSADLTQQAVDSITSLVHDNVSLLEGSSLPYADASFDVVVVVDMLEHVEDDALFVAELERVLTSDGVLIINAPHRKFASPLRLFRHCIGQTDEAHGHLRPGYSRQDIQVLLPDNLHIESSKSYSRFFSECIDTLIVAAYSLLTLLKGKSAPAAQEGEEISKGLLFTEADMKKFEKSFKLYAMIYPIVRTVARLDSVIPFIPGFMRITRIRKR